MNQAAGEPGLLRGPQGLRLLVITGGVALHAVSIYVVATIMPLVVGEIGGLAFFAWTSTIYIAGSLCSASAVPLLLSRTSARVVYRLAFGLFLTGSLVCSLAPNMAVLLLGRGLQGLGGGMLPALAYAIVRLIVAPGLHARAIALVGSVWGVAAVVGPTVGGVFAELGAWRAAFWLDVLIGIVFIAVSERVLPRRAEPGVTARPFPGVRLALLTLAAISVSAGGATGDPGPSLAGLAGATLLIGVMLRVDLVSRPRMLPAGAFNPAVAIGAVSATMGAMILSTSPGTFVPYLLRAGTGVSPLAAGYANAAFAVAWTLASLATAPFGRNTTRLMIGLGPPVMFAGLVTLAFALRAGSLAGVVAALLLLGTGIGIAWPHLGALMLQVVPAAERDVAGPFISTTQTLAAVFGSSLAGMTANLAGLARAGTLIAVAHVGLVLFASMAVAPLIACALAWRALTLTKGPVAPGAVPS